MAKKIVVRTVGQDEAVQFIGSSPFGGNISYGLRIPSFVNTNSNRYLFMLGSYTFADGVEGRICELGQYVTLGVDTAPFLNPANSVPSRVVELPITTPSFHLANGDISWHLYTDSSPRAQGGISRSNIATGGFAMQTSDTPSLLFDDSVGAGTLFGNGVVKFVTITSGGAAYFDAFGNPAANVTFVGGLAAGGVAATGTVIINSSGHITGVTITSGGGPYNSAPAVVFAPVAGGTGAGAAGIANVAATGKPLFYWEGMTAYTPPNGGRPWGDPANGELGSFTGIHASTKVDVPIKGPKKVTFFGSVLQGDPTQPGYAMGVPTVTPINNVGIGFPPEEVFVAQMTQSTNGSTVIGPQYWRIAGSMTLEV